MSLYLRNSFIVVFFITLGQIATATLAAYAFAFLDFPLKRTIFVLFLATLMVPFEVTIITNYSTVADLDWVNTYQGLIVPFLATGFGAFLLRQSFLTLPKDLEEAARLDGYGHWRFLWRVVIPLSRPRSARWRCSASWPRGTSTSGRSSSREDDSVRTVQVGLRQLSRTELDRFPVTFAGTILAALPDRDPADHLPEAAGARIDRGRREGLNRWATRPRARRALPCRRFPQTRGVTRS